MPFAEDGQRLSPEDRARINALLFPGTESPIPEAELRAIPRVPIVRLEDRLAEQIEQLRKTEVER